MNTKKYSILIVDDSPNIINIIVEVLSLHDENYIFLQANNGEVAYKIAVAKMPDIIITDWDMPIVNGIELINNLKSNIKTSEIPIIMATAVMQTSDDLKTALNAGAIDYIRKPIDPVELCARVKSVLKISEYNKTILETKNKELAESTLFLIKNNKFNLQLINKLEELQEKNPSFSQDVKNDFKLLIESINDKVHSDSWQKFEISFKSVYKNFSTNLLKKYPNLTNSEMKLCIFLRIGMSTKDISSVLFQSPGSIKVTRSRLRKKLELSQDQNLTVFLASF